MDTEGNMSNTDGRKDFVKRIFSFLAGALLTFAVMSFTVVAKEKAQNADLTAALDASRYQAGRLLSDARAQLANREYEGARTSLGTLFEKYPGSTESAAGKVLFAEVAEANKAADAKWAKVLPDIKQKWTADRVAAIRGESEAARLQMEKGLSDKLAQEWENAKDAVRKDWEAASQL